MQQKQDSRQTNKPGSTPANAPSAPRVIDGQHLANLSWVERLEAAAKLLGCDPKDIKISMVPQDSSGAKPVKLTDQQIGQAFVDNLNRNALASQAKK